MAGNQAIRLYYIDDHQVTRSGFRTIFRSTRDTVTVVGEANSVRQALEEAGNTPFDIILLDLWFPSGDPLNNFSLLRAAFPDHPIVIYTGDRTTFWQRRMYKAGANGYIDKDAGKTEIRTILEQVMSGSRCFPNYRPENEFKKVIDGYRDAQYKLSEEEPQVVALLLEGLPSTAIAEKLALHTSTVDKALRRIRKKFKVSTNIELVKALLTMDSV